MTRSHLLRGRCQFHLTLGRNAKEEVAEPKSDEG